MRGNWIERALVLSVLFIAAAAQAQTRGPVERYTATSANVNGAGEPITIEILRWSTDADRDRLVSVLAWYGEKEVPVAMPTVGYLWTSASAGYSLRYAYRIPANDGGQRIILMTDRQLGAWDPDAWKPVKGSAPAENPFSVVELRVNKAGQGEGKASLTTKTIIDAATKSIALDNYAAQPVVLQGVVRK